MKRSKGIAPKTMAKLAHGIVRLERKGVTVSEVVSLAMRERERRARDNYYAGRNELRALVAEQLGDDHGCYAVKVKEGRAYGCDDLQKAKRHALPMGRQWGA